MMSDEAINKVAKAGYDAMVAAYGLPEGETALAHSWDSQSGGVHADWRAVAKAMLSEARRQAFGDFHFQPPEPKPVPESA